MSLQFFPHKVSATPLPCLVCIERSQFDTPLLHSFLSQVSHVLVLEEPSLPAAQTPWNAKTDEWWHKTVTGLSSTAEVEWLQSEDRSFLLYTSGSTGKPKGVVHTIGACQTTVLLQFDNIRHQKQH